MEQLGDKLAPTWDAGACRPKISQLNHHSPLIQAISEVYFTGFPSLDGDLDISQKLTVTLNLSSFLTRYHIFKLVEKTPTLFSNSSLLVLNLH